MKRDESSERTREEAVERFKKRMEREREDEIKKKQRDLQMNRFLKFLKRHEKVIGVILFVVLLSLLILARIFDWQGFGGSNYHYGGP